MGWISIAFCTAAGINYPRMAAMPGPGFAAGPCLVKDTMQLAAFSHNNFVLGHAAMLINEGPARPSDRTWPSGKRNLTGKTAGILGMAFKAESDDHARFAEFQTCASCCRWNASACCAPIRMCKDAGFVSMDRRIAESDVLFLATPHKVYRDLRHSAREDRHRCLESASIASRMQ